MVNEIEYLALVFLVNNKINEKLYSSQDSEKRQSQER
jgi:hypothetical protein